MWQFTQSKHSKQKTSASKLSEIIEKLKVQKRIDDRSLVNPELQPGPSRDLPKPSTIQGSQRKRRKLSHPRKMKAPEYIQIITDIAEEDCDPFVDDDLKTMFARRLASSQGTPLFVDEPHPPEIHRDLQRIHRQVLWQEHLGYFGSNQQLQPFPMWSQQLLPVVTDEQLRRSLTVQDWLEAFRYKEQLSHYQSAMQKRRP